MLKSLFRLLAICTCASAVLLCCGEGIAAEKGTAGKVPTSIKAAGMEYNADAQVVVFRGNVHVKRPDFELWAEKMTIYLDKSGRSASSQSAGLGAEGMQAGDIDRIVAEKNVRLKSEEKQGTSETATYFAKEDKFVMEGSPVILKDGDKNTIKGRRVIHFLGANRSEVQGRGGVEAIFFTPDRSEKNGQEKSSNATGPRTGILP